MTSFTKQQFTEHKLLSPAKLNLFLHVNGRRADGYHELQTLFQFLNYGDTITLALNNAKAINLLTPVAGVDEQDNLIVKAAMMLMPYNKTPYGIDISIEKILPMGGGLGGGSSNAATILLALNSMWQINFTLTQLADIGLQLGADVPIFIHGVAAFAEGVGEKIFPASPKECWYLVSKPNCHISTQVVFQSPDLPRDTPKISHQALDTEHRQNDCEVVVIKHYPEVAKLLSTLVEYAPSRMTGTGACIFTCCTSEQEALHIKAQLPSEIESFVAKGVNQSPVHAMLKNMVK
ncbi:4-(cytidine 5'-diphospho)-2-C-methyl-D-erythritol kinase [Colwellia sp. MEBiC06753]